MVTSRKAEYRRILLLFVKGLGARLLPKPINSVAVSSKVWCSELDVSPHINWPGYGLGGGSGGAVASLVELCFHRLCGLSVLEFLRVAGQCRVTLATQFSPSLVLFETDGFCVKYSHVSHV